MSKSSNYVKDFDGWNEEKKEIHQSKRELYFHERDLVVQIGY